MSLNKSSLPVVPQDQHANPVLRLLAVISALRDPQTGCPWDLAQTHASLRPYMLEEAYEAVEAMSKAEQHPSSLKEELGDVLLQVVLHAQLAKEQRWFDFDEICDVLTEKMIRRHPHVFPASSTESGSLPRPKQSLSKDDPSKNDTSAAIHPEHVETLWNTIKQQEKQGLSNEGVVSNVSKGLPALLRAQKVSQKAVKVGFAWPSYQSLKTCVQSEWDEFFLEAEPFGDTPKQFSEAQRAHLEDELGDMLFATVNLARHFGIDAETALSKATIKFIRRFECMETLIGAQSMALLSFEDWDALWRQAKQALNIQASNSG